MVKKNNRQSMARAARRQAAQNAIKQNPAPKEEVSEEDKDILATKESKHIEVHKDKIIDLDKKREKLMSQKAELVETGYKSEMVIVSRPSRWNAMRMLVNRILGSQILDKKWVRELILPQKFVEHKVVTRCATIVYDPKQKFCFFAPCPIEMLNHQSVLHIEPRENWCGKKEYYAVMDMIPEPQEVFFQSGVSPLCERVSFELTEVMGKDEIEGKVRGDKGEKAHYRMRVKSYVKDGRLERL